MNLITISRRSQLYPKKKKRSIDPAAIDPSLEIQLTRWRTINSIARSEIALNSRLQSTLLIRIRQVTRRRFIHGLLIKLLPPPPPTIEEGGGRDDRAFRLKSRVASSKRRVLEDYRA